MYMCCLHLKVGFKRSLLGVRKTRLLKLKGRGVAKGGFDRQTDRVIEAEHKPAKLLITTS